MPDCQLALAHRCGKYRYLESHTMSLRLRLNLLINLVFTLVLAIAVVFVILNAQKSVAEEIESSAGLTLQLLTAATLSVQAEDQRRLQTALVQNLGTLGNVRHLNIALLGGDGQTILPATENGGHTIADAPQWFVRLVAPSPVEFRRRLSAPKQPYTEIVIRPNPADEITEVWKESRLLLGFLFLFTLMANGLIFLTLGRALQPIDRISTALKIIEQGDYKARLPHFNMPEFGGISEKFNRMAQELERHKKENQGLTKRTLAIQETERRHLARELHDELGQSISAIKAVALSMGQHRDARDSDLQESAQSIVAICNHVYGVVRGMMGRLRPEILDELGVVTALERMVDDWNARHEEVFCRFSLAEKFKTLGEEININLYRIVQECLTNVAKHAHATEVIIDLRLAENGPQSIPNQLELEIKDNGVGFDKRDHPGGFGLLGMRERVASLNGDMEVTTAPGGGVRIRISLPIELPPGNI